MVAAFTPSEQYGITKKLYVTPKLNPIALAAGDVAFELMIVVLASTVGAAPFTPVNTGMFGATALNTKYLFAVAPEVGKSPGCQVKSI